MNLMRQTATYFVANIASAAFGLLNVIIFTRLIHPADYSIYVIGVSFAAILVPVLSTWRDALGAISVALAILAAVIYVWQTLRSQVRPHPLSWLLFGVLSAVG